MNRYIATISGRYRLGGLGGTGYRLAVAAMAHGDFVLAESTLEAIAKLAPKSWQIKQAQGQVARALKKDGQARTVLEQAVALAPTETAI